uniref:Carrier domain-containing protein n=1 Tax=Alexandrium catenella TaxID=2925 RepID=A0A7S1QY46_ALECA
MLYSVAETQLSENDLPEAARAANEALAFFRELGDTAGVADSLRILVGVHRAKEELDSAEEMIMDSLERFRENDDLYGEGAMLLSYSEINGPRRNEEAVRHGSEALQIFQELGNDRMQAATHLALMGAHQVRGSAKDSLEASTAALELYRKTDDKKGEGKALHGLALAYGVAEKWGEALKNARSARTIFQDLGLTAMEAAELNSCALFNEKLKDYKAMEQDAQESMELHQSVEGHQGEAEAMHLLVKAFTASGDEESAMSTAETALGRFKTLDFKKGQAVAMECIVNNKVGKVDAEEVLPLAQETLELMQEQGDQIGQATMLYTIADIHMADKKFEEARQSAQDSMELMKAAGDARGQAGALLNILATVYTALQQWAEALNSASEAQELYQQAGDVKGEGLALFVYGTIYQMISVWDQAEQWVREAQKIFQEMGEGRLHIQALHTLGTIMVKTERLEEAVKFGQEALQLSNKDKDKALEVQMTLFMVQIYFAMLNRFAEKEGGNRNSREFTDPFSKAEKAATSAVKLTEKMEDPPLKANALYSMAEVNLIAGKFREAENQASDAEKIFEDTGVKAGEASCATLKAQVCVYTGRFQEAVTAAEKALEIGSEIGDAQIVDQANKLLERVRGSQAQPAMMMQQQMMQEIAAPEPEVSSAIEPEKPKGLDPLMVGDMLHGMLREMVGVQMESDTPFMDAGVDSLMSIEFRSQVNQAFAGLQLASTLTFDYPTIRELTGHIVDKSLA